jgi:predicted Zn-dependent protease with MMP-like domain
MQSPCNALTRDYTQIFYVIDEGDMPSIQCKMSLRGPKPVRKVDINPVRTSEETHYVSATKPSRLMLFRETVVVYCENHTENTGQNAEFGILKQVVHIITTGLERVNYL